VVNYWHHELDRAYAALVAPTRRAILSRAGQKENLSISTVATPFAIELSGVTKHLAVQGGAGVIGRARQGRSVDIRLSRAPDRLAAYAEGNEAQAETGDE
jgi:DNA-binding transcriptional ArsR family regulator